MKDARDVQVAHVFRNRDHVGTLSRSGRGCHFRYLDDFFERHRQLPGGLSVHLPYAVRERRWTGDNLPPYFAGLLPEGLRLQALLRRTRTSEDDLFSLLIAAGPDAVGDLTLQASTEPAERQTPAIDPRRAAEVRFAELWRQALDSTEEPPVPGVQPKLSPAMVSFPVRGASRRKAYLLKLNPAGLPTLISNEHFCMKLAAACGLEVARTWLVRDRDGVPGLLVERFDRRWNAAEARLEGLHVEDGCQLLDRYPADKYRLSVSELMGALEVCAAPAAARLDFLRLVAFSYLVGNGDLHAKNVSVVATAGLVLSPAYDLLTTLPYGDRRLALRMEGRDDNVRTRDVLALARRFAVPAGAVERMLGALGRALEPRVEAFVQAGLPPRKTSDWQRTTRKRLLDLAV